MGLKSNQKEVSHYVVTAHAPGGALMTCKCNFLSPTSEDVLVAKSRRLEVRQLRSTVQSEQGQHASNTSSSAVETSVSSPFPVVYSVPINGRLTSLLPLRLPASLTSYVFMTTARFRYAIVSASGASGPYPFQTHASGSLRGEDYNILGRHAECAPLVAVDPYSRCVALHLYDGLLTILPIDLTYDPSTKMANNQSSAGKPSHYDKQAVYWPNNTSSRGAAPQLVKEPFHARIEERNVLAITFLHSPADSMPQVSILYQDSRGTQIIVTHAVDLKKRQLLLYGSYSAASSIDLLKRVGVDGGSSILIPLPSRSSPVAAAAAAAAPGASVASDEAGFQNRKKRDSHGGVIILGQRQITYTSLTTTKVLAVPPSLMLSWEELPPDPSGMPRFLLGDEFGNLHMLMLRTQNERGVALQMDTLGSCTLSSSLVYLGEGLVYVGSIMGDSQLVQVHEEPITTGGTNTSTSSLPMPTDDLSATAVPPDVMEDLDTTYLSVVEEYTHLGPIVDFDLVPTAPGLGDANAPSGNQVSTGQSQVVTASGTSRSGTIRLIRNGIGMNEYASVEMSGIQNMWSVRAHYADLEDAYLVQSFVGQTRVLGVCKATPEDVEMDCTEEDEEVGGTLAEVVLGGLDSNASSLYIGNIQAGDRLLQITESELRLVKLGGDDSTLDALAVWRPEGQMHQSVTVATANEAGQIVIALRGGLVIYLSVENDGFKLLQEKQMDREVSCLDVHPFSDLQSNFMSKSDAMDLDGEPAAPKSSLVAVGLWDDFTVRLLSLDCALEEAAQIHLSVDEDEEGMENPEGNNATRRNRNNMMARSLCLLTLDFSSSVSSHASSTALMSYPGVDMLFVGLGDGTVVSFAIVSAGQKDVTVHSKKEVCLGTQRINLIPLKTESGGTCVLATGDRPTVIYLAGVGGGQHNAGNPKLCYSNVNLQVNDEDQAVDVSRPASQQSIAVNVASPFYSSLLFEASSLGTQYYSLCVADDNNLRLGVIDDIQKLHVTTCRLGMSPRRVAHCSEGRMFAVGCIESGIKQFGLGMETHNLGNCIRFLDDTNFDDIERIDLEPFEMILSMVYASVRICSTSDSGEESSTVGEGADHANSRPSDIYKPFLFVGTGYALPDEDEPTRGRLLVFSCGDPDDEATGSAHRAVRKTTELVVSGGVFSISQFYEGKILASVNSKTHICQMTDEGSVGGLRLSFVGMGHHGHILSLFVKSCAGHVNATTQLAQQQLEAASATQQQSSASMSVGMKKKPPKQEKDMLAIVGDLMRSISVVQYYPQHETLEEVSRDFNTNWTTAVEMLTDDVYLGGENWNNLFVLRRNAKAKSEELRCRLDTIGEFHLGEMCNKFMRGSLVMPQSSNASSSSNRRAPSRRSAGSPKKRDGTPNKIQAAFRKPTITIGSQTLFGTVEGTLGSILGLDAATAAFFSTLERAINRIIRPVGDFTHQHFRAFEAERRVHPCHGFVDGDLIESFLDLDRATMDAIVHEMNRDGGWEIDRSSVSGSGPGRNDSANNVTSNSDAEAEEFVGHPELSVDDVVAMVEEMSMLH